MATITDLTKVLADSLGIGHAPVANAARTLRENKLLPTGERGRLGGVAMTSENAATMLIGFLGALRVCDSHLAARTFAKLPAVAAVYQKIDGARVTRVTHEIEDIPVGPGEELGRTALMGSLHGLLFVWLMLLLLQGMKSRGRSFGWAMKIGISSLIPFGIYMIDAGLRLEDEDYRRQRAVKASTTEEP